MSVSISGVSVIDAPGGAAAGEKSDAELDLLAAYTGAGNFMARAELLSNMRRRIEAAEAASKAASEELKLGTDAKSAIEAGRAKEEAAARLCEQAEGIMALSQSEAAKIRAAAEAAAAQTRAAADVVLKNVSDTLAGAKAKEAQAEATLAAALQRQEEADMVHLKLEKKISALNDAIDKAMSDLDKFSS